MDLIDNLGKTFSGVAKQVEIKSGKLLEIGRLNIEILKEEELIKKLTRQIGELVYKAYVRDEQYNDIADDMCALVTQRKVRVKKLRRKIKDIKETSTDIHDEIKATEHAKTNIQANIQSAENKEEPSMAEGSVKSHIDPGVSYYTAMQKLNENKQDDL